MSDTQSKAAEWPNSELAEQFAAKNLLTPEQIDAALKNATESNLTFAQSVIRLRLLPKQETYEELAAVYGVPFVDLETYGADPLVTSLVSEKLARELDVFPLFTIGESLTIALTDPGDITVTDRVAAASKHNIEACLATSEDIREAINRAYGSNTKVKELLDEMEDGDATDKTSMTGSDAAHGDKSPVSQLVDLIVAQAVRDRASDIHIDPEENTLRIRFRIDGLLYEIPPPPKHLHPFIISRTKVISNMDIAESRVPQDGHFEKVIDGRTIEARVSSMPTIHGENLAIRLLDTEQMAIPIEHLGIAGTEMPKLTDMIRRPHGMVVVTGPTGSGKSTTLYAMLGKAKSPDRHIITIEDPVERRMELISQTQINERAGVTFSTALRSILRQDPDVIMVGEIRDQETAQLAIRAALTGHLLFSTIHTNDAPGVVTRLINMNIEPFLVASSLAGVVAQRLARRICSECKEPEEVSKELRKRLAAIGIDVPDKMFKGKGCQQCRETGYSGRIAIFELMKVTPALGELIIDNASSAKVKEQAIADGMVTILEDAVLKAAEGVTSMEEVLRIAQLDRVEDVPQAEPTTAEMINKPERPSEAPEEKSGLDLDNYKDQMANWLAEKGRSG